MCFLDVGDIEKIGGDKVKQVIKIRNGIEADDAKKIVRVIKDGKMKVPATIQGEAVRVTGAKRDDLQAAIAMLRKDVTDMPLEFEDFRELFSMMRTLRPTLAPSSRRVSSERLARWGWD